MVKLFVGNLPAEASQTELKALFEQFGRVTECDIIKNFAFVHMEDKKSADDAVQNLNQYKLHGVAINVENSRGKPKTSTKLHVSNLNEACTTEELRAKFEVFGAVLECDIVKDYAFVHMETAEEALEAIRNLDTSEFKGKPMHVQLSKSRLRITPGMGGRSRCYRCGKEGHWSKECPLDQMAQEMEQPPPAFPHDPYADPFDPVRNMSATAYGAAYAERAYYDERDRCNIVDYYQRYRVRPSSYDPYLDRRLPSFPPAAPAANMYREQAESFPYERQLLPPPSTLPNTYYPRERSPIRRSSNSSVEGFRSERQMSPVLRNPLYDQRYNRESYTDQPRYF
uniref:Uncharacterized protein n=1 Tax=Leptobrachium leishanense TaxID=445787 RepID=A0A8C5N4P0_9ANUR